MLAQGEAWLKVLLPARRLAAGGTGRAVKAAMRCPNCDLEHEGPCLRALGNLVLLLTWEVRELRATVDHLRAERARAVEWRTARTNGGR